MTPPGDLAALAAAMRAQGVDELRIEDAESCLIVKLDADAGMADPAPASRAQAVTLALSPELGRFAAGGKGVNDAVAAGEIVAFTVVEALRLPVVAPAAGVIVERLLADGDPVGYRAPVLRIAGV